MKTTKLYRPVGVKELELILNENCRAFPPRLDWQPIFYPVLNLEYAAEIAQQWNITDEASGYCGIVTSFEVSSSYLEQFEIQNVGYTHHNELWVLAEELATFNANIQGFIQIEALYYGAQFKGFDENVAQQIHALMGDKFDATFPEK